MKKRKFLFIWVLALSLVLAFNFILTKNAKNSELSLLGLGMNIAHAQSECPDDEEDKSFICTIYCPDGSTAEGIEVICIPGTSDCSPHSCDAVCTGNTPVV